ncbi:MAG: 50S ribosomal protein L35 [Ruminococcus sp.]|jgi:large subunit ribosomal protein L35|nr:50S ribosomal protein L35 [Ruminococcus sp.]
MNKQKSHSGAKKRFKVTGTGKVTYQRTNKRHRLTQKAHKRKRLARRDGVCSAANAATMKILLPYK